MQMKNTEIKQKNLKQKTGALMHILTGQRRLMIIDV